MNLYFLIMVSNHTFYLYFNLYAIYDQYSFLLVGGADQIILKCNMSH